MLTDIEELAKPNNDLDKYINKTFKLQNSTFKLTEEDGKNRAEHAKGLLRVGIDDIRCSLWKLSTMDHDYNLIASYYCKQHTCLPKIYHLTMPNEVEGIFLVVSEEIFGTLKDLKKPALDDHANFLYPLRSLFDSVAALREFYPDFNVASQNVFLTKSKNLVTKSESSMFKIGFLKPSSKVNPGLYLQCTQDISKILQHWIGVKYLSNDLKVLLEELKVIKTEKMNFKMLRTHPIFYVGESRILLLDFVIKFHRIISNQGKNERERVNAMLIKAFDIMNYIGIHNFDSEWYSEEWYSRDINSPIRMCIDFELKRSQDQRQPQAHAQDQQQPQAHAQRQQQPQAHAQRQQQPQAHAQRQQQPQAHAQRQQQPQAHAQRQKQQPNRIRNMSKVLRNIATHGCEHGLYRDDVCPAMEKLRPDCYAALHYAALTELANEFEFVNV
ncbi:uncharacterized protein LOC115997598 [Ipomoea triloba]|uniref:uncharacterized protein LOC115997598 n=1 Tax=Ipomoea triloba TaxID=35885 RepID=UPI00125DC0B5|nr:uncharacterized protein LOC115997598 [Ipomoea triloba]XP_031093049.1 uncharacterized protein LOC115997598 [Ipomoea triloba]